MLDDYAQDTQERHDTPNWNTKLDTTLGGVRIIVQTRVNCALAKYYMLGAVPTGPAEENAGTRQAPWLPSPEEGNGKPSSCEASPRIKYAEAAFILV